MYIIRQTAHVAAAMNEQERMIAQLEKKQMSDFLRLYNNLTEGCFGDCVHDFTTRNLSSKEETCITRCTGKFLKLSQRVGARFAEQQMLQQEAIAAGAR